MGGNGTTARPGCEANQHQMVRDWSRNSALWRVFKSWRSGRKGMDRPEKVWKRDYTRCTAENERKAAQDLYKTRNDTKKTSIY